MVVCVRCVTQLEVRRGGGAGGPNKTAIRRYVTFTDVSSLPPTYENATPRSLHLPRFLRDIILRGGCEGPEGIMAVVGAGKDQFVHNNAGRTRDARAFASRPSPPAAAPNIDVIERRTGLNRLS